MKLLFLCITFLLTICTNISGQQLPVIRATSKVVDVRDGNHFKKALWYIMPEKRPDTYYVEVPRKIHQVTFYTDKDSISFNTKYGGKYNFVILLNGKDSCYTQIVAAPKKLLTPVSTIHKGIVGSDTIPFTIGNNDKIFIKASINHSDTLKFQFDLGSSISGIKTNASKKVNFKFDPEDSNGERISSNNYLQIAKLSWDSVIFQVYDHNLSYREDGLLGNGLFMDKVVEINYDKMIIVVHDSVPKQISSYHKQDMIFEGVVPQIQATVQSLTGKKAKLWFIYDTGDSGNAYISADMAAQYQLYDGVNKIITVPGREIVRLPSLIASSYRFNNLSAILGTPDPNRKEFSILGNALLKRFNVILDNRNGYIYIKANSIINEPFENIELKIYGSIATVILVLIVIAALTRLIYKKRKLKRLSTGRDL